MMDNHQEYEQDIVDASGMTLYNTLKNMPMGTLLIAIHEDEPAILVDLVINIAENHKDKYPYIEDFPTRYQEAEALQNSKRTLLCVSCTITSNIMKAQLLKT